MTVSPGAAVHRARACAVPRSRRQLRSAGEPGSKVPGDLLRLVALLRHSQEPGSEGAELVSPGWWGARGTTHAPTRLHPRSAQLLGHTALCLRPHPTQTAPRGLVSKAVSGETQDATVTLLGLSPTPRNPVCRASQAFQPSEASSRSLHPPSTASPASSVGLAPQVGPARPPGHRLRAALSASHSTEGAEQRTNRIARPCHSCDDPPPATPDHQRLP